MFTFPVEPEDLFVERAAQMSAWGIPKAIVRDIRSSIHSMWESGEGGWTFEWTRRAERAERRGKWLLAAALHGGARFPVACTPERRTALDRQIDCFSKAAASFPVAFERRAVAVRTAQGTIEVPAHVYGKKRPRRPVVLLSGGVDTYKVELHRLALVLCGLAGVRVVAIDMPGTGETPGALTPSSDEVYAGVLDAVADDGAKRGVFGISFGGHWAAKLALTGRVDAAIDLGGPVGSVPLDADYVQRLPNGMTGIVANALGLDAIPARDETGRLIADFSLRRQGLFERAVSELPLLAINGLGDPYIPPDETLVFQGMNGAEAWVFRDGDHCAANLLPRFMPAVITYLRRRLHGESLANRSLDTLARMLLPARQGRA
jgi:esterase FrsA